MNFKKLLTIAAVLTATNLFTLAQEPSAAEWAQTDKAELDKINQASLIAIAKGAPDSYIKLLAEVKPNYTSSPLELTRIAALTQFLASCGNQSECSKYADALVAAAKASTAGDVTCFFLDQLRWCGTAKQIKAIKAFESSTQEGVADLAKIAAFAAESNFDSQRVVDKKTPSAEFSEQLSKLRGSQKFKALLAGFANQDLKIAGVAMREASEVDIQSQIAGLDSRKAESINKRRIAAGKEETKVWALKLEETNDPVRKVMLLDMLGTRGSPEASQAIARCMSDSDITTADAAQRALAKISMEEYAAALPALLKNLPQSHADITRKTILRVPADLMENALIKEYESFSMAGKEVTMSTLQSRKIKGGITLALAAIDSHAAESAVSGYRLLRDCATEKEADILIGKIFTERGKRLQEAQSAVAGAAKRDTTGSYIELLEKASPKASGEKKQALLETYGRIGSKPLLALTESAVKDEDKEVSTAAVRALAEWPDADSVKVLMSIALESADTKQRVLAQRGIEKKLGAKDFDKAPYKKMWEAMSQNGQGDAEIKKQLDAFFSK